jgi:4-carboxymuconolactone decarboxylase
MPRVPLIQKEEALSPIKEMFQKMEDNGSRILNLFKVVAYNPKMGRDFLKLGNAILFKADLSPRLRELAILRVGTLTRATYEWTQHVRIALETGVTQEQIDDIGAWADSPRFDEQERAVLQYTDEVVKNVKASDEAFSRLRDFLPQREVVELTVTIGYYGMVARVLESMEIELEEGLIAVPFPK